MSRVHETITRIMIERIEERRAQGDAVAPWRKTWDPALGMPRNMVTGHAYRGANVFLTLMQRYGSPFWLTLRQVNKLGGRIRKGEGYTPIVFWKFPTDEERAAGRHPFVKFYKVWNVEQCEGIDEAVEKATKAVEPASADPIEAADALVEGYPAAPEVAHGYGHACYIPGRDRVEMPNREAFEAPEAYYRAMFHELVHSTGHSKRLARDGVVNPVRFGDHGYSEEELVAEMGAAMLAAHAGISNEDGEANSAAYLDGWLRKLKAEPRWLISAGGAAQKAVDHIRNVKFDKD